MGERERSSCSLQRGLPPIGRLGCICCKKWKARKTIVQIGYCGEINWEVRGGLQAGDHVIAHPSAEVDDGVKVQEVQSRNSMAVSVDSHHHSG